MRSKVTHSKTSRRLFATAALFVFLLVATLAGLLWLVPWLGRRGDLNALVESIISSSLSVPVEIQEVCTDTFSTFSITHLRSVNARADERFHFHAREISIQYDPTAIVAGEIQSITFKEPEIFINLDADLADITRTPNISQGPLEEALSSGAAEYLLPFFVSRTLVENGNLSVRFSGRDLSFSSLNLQVSGLGKALGQTFDFSVDALGGVVRAWGGVDFLLEAGKPRRYALHSTHVTVENLEAPRLFQWLGTHDTAGSWLPSASARPGGRLQLEGSLDGTWPEELTLELSSRSEGIYADFSESWGLREADVSLCLRSTITGDLESVAFDLSTTGSGRISSSERVREAGREDASLRLAGRFFRERDSGTLDLARAEFSVAGIDRMRLSGTIASLLGEEPPQLGLSLELPSMETRSLLGSLPVSLFAGAIGPDTLEEIEGSVRAKLQLTGNLATPRVDGSFELTGASYPMASFERCVLSFNSTLDTHRRHLALGVEVSAQMREALVGPFYADFDGRSATVQASTEISLGDDHRLESVSVHSCVLHTPFTGPVTLSGDILRARDSMAFLIDAKLEAEAIPGNLAFPIFLRDPYAPAIPILEGSRLEGTGALEVRATGALLDPLYQGALSVGPAELQMENLRLSGLELALPFVLGPLKDRSGAADFQRKGFLRVSKVDSQLTVLERLQLAFRFTGESYILEAPTELRLLGGALEIAKLIVFPLDGTGDSLRATLRGKNLSVIQAARALQWPEIDGKLQFDLDPLILRKGRLESHGTTTLEAFGGKVTVSDVTLDHIEEPYANMSFREGRIDQVRLLPLGNTFNFGLMSGVLDGTIKNLGFTGGELTSFDLRVGTVPTRGVPQHLNRQAIESIQSVIAGPSTLKESLFSKFSYSEFGFTCGLENGVFRLQGQYDDNGTEYVMRGNWNQIPHINIINARPGKKYDWYTIVSSLHRIYESETP